MRYFSPSVLIPVLIHSCSNKLQFVYLTITSHLACWKSRKFPNFQKGKKEILRNFPKYKSKNIFDLIRRGVSPTNCAPLLKIIFKKRLATFVIQSTSANSNARYLELSLSGTFSLVPSTFLETFLIITFSISNPAISNFHHVEHIIQSLQLYYPTISNFFISTFDFQRKWFENFEIRSNGYLSVFIYNYKNVYNWNTMSVKQKINVKD